MVRIEKERYVDGNYNAVLDLQVSTVAELPDMGDTIGLYTVAPGSIAQIVQADEPTFVTLDDDGTWYPEQSDSSASSLNASLSAPKNLGGEREEIVEEPVETEKSVLYPDEIVKEQKKAFEESIEEPEKDGKDDDELL